MRMLSKYVSYNEMIASDTAKRLGIKNIPSEEYVRNAIFLSTNVFDPLREHFGVPIYVSSLFRSPELNKAIGGALNSQHMKAEAMDIDAERFGGVTNKQLFDFIRNNLVFDQLIWEFGTDKEPEWIHVSYSRTKNRGEVLKAVSVNGKATYSLYK
jgi:hypothetical protein